MKTYRPFLELSQRQWSKGHLLRYKPVPRNLPPTNNSDLKKSQTYLSNFGPYPGDLIHMRSTPEVVFHKTSLNSIFEFCHRRRVRTKKKDGDKIVKEAFSRVVGSLKLRHSYYARGEN